MKKIILILVVLGIGALFLITNKKEKTDTEEVVKNGNSRVMAPQELELSVGQTKSFSDLNITFNKMVADYRCPTDVQCIEAGAVVVNITLEKGGDIKENLNKPSDEIPLEFEGYKISVVKVLPETLSTREINPEDYVVTFIVESTASGDNI